MAKSKRVLSFHIDDSEHLIEIMEGLSNLNVNLEADSTPSSVKITIYGSREKVKNTSKKIRSLVEEAKSS